MELTTADALTKQATRILLRGSNDNANVEFYSGASEKEGLTMIIEGSTGNVGIGTNNPTKELYVRGDIEASGVIWASGEILTSDKKFKKEIKGIDSALNKIIKIEGVSYKWKRDEFEGRKFSEGTHFGVIGQDIEKILPEIVKENSKGEKSVAYTEIIPILVEAMKEQQRTIAELSGKVNKLESEMKLKDTMAMTGTGLH